VIQELEDHLAQKVDLVFRAVLVTQVISDHAVIKDPKEPQAFQVVQEPKDGEE
jgi:hypothetical protein